MEEMWVDEFGPPTNCLPEVRNAPQMEQVQGRVWPAEPAAYYGLVRGIYPSPNRATAQHRYGSVDISSIRFCRS
jgi:hypothetical protein